jgi:regulator of protease activity HflC (stomatin/prohibitin superfamily)
MKSKKQIMLGALLFFGLALVWGSFFIVPEGHIGIKTRFAKAIEQYGPGLHFKTPIIDGIKRIEIRERKSTEELAAATKNQLPMTSTVTVNWTVNSTAGLELYQKYGSLDQFEHRILDPKLRQAAKAALSEFNADELIRNRNAAIQRIQENLIKIMQLYPVTVNSPQIENIVLPDEYMRAVLEKEQAREAAVREEYNLQKQKLEAAQKIQTAEAERDAAKARADGEAYRVRVEAEASADATKLKGAAEAQAVELVQNAISQNPLLIQYEQAKRWDGQLPQTMVPAGAVPLLNIN